MMKKPREPEGLRPETPKPLKGDEIPRSVKVAGILHSPPSVTGKPGGPGNPGRGVAPISMLKVSVPGPVLWHISNSTWGGTKGFRSRDVLVCVTPPTLTMKTALNGTGGWVAVVVTGTVTGTVAGVVTVGGVVAGGGVVFRRGGGGGPPPPTPPPPPPTPTPPPPPPAPPHPRRA